MTDATDTAAKASGPASDYLVVEDADKPSTYHLRVRENGTVNHRLLGAAWAALHGGYRGNVYEGPGKAEALAKLKRLYEQEGMELPSEKAAAQSTGGGLLVFKDARTGKHRWLGVSSSSFVDRDGEIVSQAALEGAVAQMDTNGEYGTLDWWHIPGADLGDCDFSAIHGKSLVESGTFREAWMGEALARMGELRMSLKFRHPLSEPEDGVFQRIRIINRAVMPARAESNLLTAFSVVGKGEEMATLKDKWAAFMSKIGPEHEQEAAQFVAAVEGQEKAAEEAGLTSKAADAPAVAESTAEATTDAKADMPGDDAAPVAVGNLTPAEFMALLSEGLAPVVAAMNMEAKMADLAKTFGAGIGELKALMSSQATAKEAEDSAHAAELSALKEQQAAIAERLKELEGDTPAAFVRPSQSAGNWLDTIIEGARLKSGPQPSAGAQAAMKEREPVGDPLARLAGSVMDDLFGGAAGPG